MSVPTGGRPPGGGPTGTRHGDHCPACGGPDLETFVTVEGVPANSSLLLDDQREAREFPRADLALAWCPACGFITNRAHDEGVAEYSARYEETQGFSPHFVDFARAQAKSWVDRHDLHGKHVVEIGCGKGDFLVWMLEAGAGSGLGIDPGVAPDRVDAEVGSRITWVADLYDEGYATEPADAIVCRHTLEHIHPVRDFLAMIRRTIGDRTDTVVLFELPDTTRVLEEVAFWDVYYEHCSYFTAGSLARLFASCGFEVTDLTLAFDDQYLLVDARPAATAPAALATTPLVDDRDRVRRAVETFTTGYHEMVGRWRGELEALATTGDTAVLWGGGSKAVAFLVALGRDDLVAGAVDINPYKQGRYIAGTGHPVLAPRDLVDLQPSLVIAMNPVYRDEIQDSLIGLGLTATRLVTV